MAVLSVEQNDLIFGFHFSFCFVDFEYNFYFLSCVVFVSYYTVLRLLIIIPIDKVCSLAFSCGSCYFSALCSIVFMGASLL